jgi:hypothetical protein
MGLRRQKRVEKTFGYSVVFVYATGMEPDCQRLGYWRILHCGNVGRLNGYRLHGSLEHAPHPGQWSDTEITRMPLSTVLAKVGASEAVLRTAGG